MGDTVTKLERIKHFRHLGLKSRCPVCSKMIGKHCPRRLHLCYTQFIEHEGPEVRRSEASPGS